MIRLLHPQHKAVIEGLQPYKRTGPRRLDFLHLLSEINNADKHRLIQTPGPRMRTMSFKMTVGDVAVGLPPLNPRFVVLEHGAKVMEAGPHVKVEPEIVPRVVFWKGCAAVKYLPVHETLVGSLQRISNIVEAFTPAFRFTSME